MSKNKNSYGLPLDVKFCKNCVISNQRPSSTVEFKTSKIDKKEVINFNENGVCSACVFHETKMQGIDWEDRERFHLFAGYVLGVARGMGITLRWGGDWNMNFEVDDNKFDDFPHFELR